MAARAGRAPLRVRARPGEPALTAREPVPPDLTAGGGRRLWWTLAGCALINWSIQLLIATTSLPWVTGLVVVAGGWGLITILVSWSGAHGAAGPRLGSTCAWLTAILLVATFAAWAYVQVRADPGYGTDELAFDQYAAQLVRHGANPYVHSMAPAFPRFHVSPDGYTYNLAGAAVTRLSYPALAFLVYVPFVALGWSSQLAVALNVLAWAVTVLMVFAILPRRQRAAALVIGSMSVYVSYAVGGITDVLYMPLLVLAAYRWDRFGRGRRAYLGPVSLGLAMAVKQTPWLLLPFILCALAQDEHLRGGTAAALRRCGRYLAAVAIAFLLPNVAYIVAAPGAWWHGVLTPIAGQLVPAGQGAVALSLFLRLGGGSLVAFSIATIVLALLLLTVYAGTFPLLRAATFLLPAIVLFFASRSYGSYLVSLIPPALVAAMTCRPPRLADATAGRRWRGPPGAIRSARWGAVIGVGTLAFAGAIVHALTDRQPLSLRIASIRTTGQLATIERITVAVTNRSSHALRPAFTVDEGGGVTTFWTVTSGPEQLAAGASARYAITAPNYPAQPSIEGGFTVLAFARHPGSVSATGAYTPSTLHVALTPAAVNRSVAVHRAVTVRAQLLDQLDRPVHRGDVPVYLGQVIYAQGGLELGEARIDGHAPGQTPVRAYTNHDGVASFRVVGTQPGPNPVYFEANLVQSEQFFPYGYSEILPIRFAGR